MVVLGFAGAAARSLQSATDSIAAATMRSSAATPPAEAAKDKLAEVDGARCFRRDIEDQERQTRPLLIDPCNDGHERGKFGQGRGQGATTLP